MKLCCQKYVWLRFSKLNQYISLIYVGFDIFWCTFDYLTLRSDFFYCVDYCVDNFLSVFYYHDMETLSQKRVAKVRATLNKRTIESLEPENKSWIAWDDKVVGFGIRVQPSGTKSFIVNYRSGDGGRKAPNKRIVIGRYGKITADQARKKAQDLLGRVARGDDPAKERSEARSMPTLGEAFEDYLSAGSKRKLSTIEYYRDQMRLNLGDWLSRPLDSITRRDVETRFHQITEKKSWANANQSISMLSSVYRRPCVDIDGLRNPVELWLLSGGRYHRIKRRRISSPAEVLPCWKAGIDAEVKAPLVRGIFQFGLYTGMRLGEIIALEWSRVELDRGILRVEETKTYEPLELPITRQLSSVLEEVRMESGYEDVTSEGWVFPSTMSKSGHIEDVNYLYPRISGSGGTKFWFHGLRNCFITVAERELMLPRSLTKRLVNHARPSDVTEGYAADWTVEQLREPAQRIADRIDELMRPTRSNVIETN